MEQEQSERSPDAAQLDIREVDHLRVEFDILAGHEPLSFIRSNENFLELGTVFFRLLTFAYRSQVVIQTIV